MNISTANLSLEVSPTTDLVFEQWFEYYAKQGELLYHYGFPLFLFIGLLGNILSVILMTRGTFRQMSSGVYLLFLSISDLSICALSIANWLPEATMNYYISNHEAVCKGTQYVGKLLEHTSSWMIVAVTVERAIVVTMPHRAKVISTRKKAWIVSGLIVLVLGLINIYQPLIVGIVEDGYCFFVEGINDELFGIVFALIDLFVYSFIPSTVLTICNIVLVVKLKESLKFRSTAGGGEGSDNDTKKVIAMVISISIVFIVLTLPHSCFIISDFVPQDILYVPTTRELWYYIVALGLTLNHSVNFFLYFLTGPKFRQEFWKLFNCCRDSPKANNDNSVTNKSCTVSTVM